MTSAGQVPAVVVSGHTMALAVVRSLGEAGVPVDVLHYDARDTAQESRHVVADVRVPSPLVDEEGFVAALLRHGERRGRSILFPASDESTVVVSRHKRALEGHYIVACPEWEIVEQFIDKSRTSALADAHGVPSPRTTVPRSEEELVSQAADIGFPVLLKPAEGHLFQQRFGRKMIYAANVRVLLTWYRATLEAGLTMMLQEIIPGPDSAVVNYNAYVVNGTPRAEFTARQLRKAPPAFGSPRVAISEQVPGVVEPGRKILAAMGFYGFACTEFKQDARDGVYKLMEVNGRHNLSGLLAIRSGVDFPLMHYRHLAFGEIPDGTAYRPGLYWTDVFRDAGYTARYLTVDRHSPAAYLTPYARRHCDAILDRRDMGPFWARLRYFLRTGGRAVRSTAGR